MALEFLTNPFDLNAIYGLATSQGFEYWVSMGVNVIVSTIVGGLLLILIMWIFSSKFGENVHLANSFIVVLLANIINMLGVLGLLLPFIAGVPFLGFVLPFLVWVVLLKLFFKDMGMLHIVIVAIVFMLVMIFVTPQITGYVSQFIPSFG